MEKEMLRTIFSTCDLSKKQLSKIVNQYDERVGLSHAFWNQVKGDPSLGEDVASELRFTLKLGELTMYHLALLRELQHQRQEGVIKGPKDLLDQDWKSLIKKRVEGKIIGTSPDVSGETEDEKANNYAEALRAGVPRLFPAAVIARRVENLRQELLEKTAVASKAVPTKAGKDAKRPGTLPGGKGSNAALERLSRFFEQNPTFDLSLTPIDELLDADTRKDLKSLRRLSKITPTKPSASLDLHMDGFASAHDVARMGRANFLAQYGSKLGLEAKSIHANAEQQSLMASVLFARYSPALNSVAPAMVPSPVTNLSDRPSSNLPEWASLFGTLNLCDIVDDRSVLSAGAYLVDVLHFLDQQKLKCGEKEKTALEILLERRPDVAWLELSSSNTHTTLPYVDLVNEVLEAAFFPLQFKIDAGSEKELDQGKIPEKLKQQFEGEGHHLTDGARVLIKEEDKGIQWHIRDGVWIYEINLAFENKLDVSANVTYQTAATTDELAANPEYLIAEVYDRLANEEVYPWNLPFGLWTATARLYLKHLGLPRYQLMEKFGPVTEREISVATEYLGMTPKEREIITADNQKEQPWQYWSLEKKGNDFPDLENPGTTVKLDWIESLGRVPVFLERSGLDYKRLTELLATRFINSQGSIEVKFPAPSGADSDITSACDLDRAQIVNLKATHLDKIHRFVRLQRKTGWSIPELDQVIRVLENVNLDADLIVAARFLRQLQMDLSIPLDELLSWYANIDTIAADKEIPSFYERLFLNKTVLRPVDENFTLNQDRTDLKFNDGRTIKHSFSTILAALRIDAEELESILDVEFPPQSEVKLNLENLSRIHRIVSLSRAVKLSVQDLLSLRAMIGISPFDRKNMAATQRFIEIVHMVRASRFSITELDYLLRHQYDEARDHFVPTDEEIARVLADIGIGLSKIDEEFAVTEDTTGELTRKRLTQLMEPTEAQRVMDVLSKSADNDTSQADDSLEVIREKLKKVFPWLIETLEIFEKASKDFPPPESKFQEVLKRVNDYLNQTSSKALVAQRLGSALQLDADIIDLVLNHEGQSLLNDFLALKSGGLSRDSVGGNWSGMVQTEKGGRYEFELGEGGIKLKIGNREITNGNESITMDAETGAFYNVDLVCDGGESTSIIWKTPRAPDDEQGVPASKLVPAAVIRTFRQLHKLSLMVNKLRIEATELNCLVDHGADFQDFDWNKFPLEPTRDAPLFNQWQHLYNLFTFRDHYMQAETRLVDVLAAAHQSQDAAREQLQVLTGWDEEDLNELVGEYGLHLTDADYRGGGRFEELHQAFILLKRMGTSAKQLLDWAATADFPLSQSLKQAVKAKYDEQQWLEVAKPLEDTLREKRRAALLAYHMAKAGLRNTHDLYQHYLLDVEMSPCMMTSRTKIAISSVQLFIQRCLMNLEAWRIASPQQALEWKRLWEWMKNYRVWEANRKIFLYPENWIEPELRRDKTPFFKELENELLSGELTAGLAESAFLNYLDKLDAVARLEICGLYHEVESDTPNGKGEITVDVLHVFGHTRGIPKVYYYRRRAHGAWTPWEQVNVEIQGDHLIPVVFNRRLYLFWPIFNEKTEVLKGEDGQPIKDKQDKQKMWHFWEVHLAFSEYRQGMWSAKKISDQRLIWDPVPEGDEAKGAFTGLGGKVSHPCEPQDRSKLTFKTRIADEVLQILCARRKDGENNAYAYLGGFRFTHDAQVDTHLKTDLDVLAKDCPVSSPVKNGEYENMAVIAEGGLSFNTNDGGQLLAESPSPFTLVFPHQLRQKDWQDCFFYQDADRVFFVQREGSIPRADSGSREEQEVPAGNVSVEAALSAPSFPVETLADSSDATPATTGANGVGNRYRFENAYHPLTHEFMKHLNRDGIDGLLHRSVQRLRREPLLFWLGDYERQFFEKNNLVRVEEIFNEHDITFSGDLKIEKEKNDDFERWKISDNEIVEGGSTKPIWTCYVEKVPEGLYAYRDFAQQYAPCEGTVEEPYPAGVADFDAGGFHSQYNWELFFHAPLMIADRLSKNQRFEAAQQWFHHIFDPTDISGYKPPERYWQVLPFFQEATDETIQDLLALLGYHGDDQKRKEAREKLERQLEQWRQDPFEPHLIARLRLGAYQKTVVMKYIDNLIAWGDQLFRRDTIESINEATQLYILAAEILGKHPAIIPLPWESPPQTFEEMRKDLNTFSGGPLQLEERLPAPGTHLIPQGKGIEAVLGASQSVPYFGVPRNEKLLSYWDTVADRLFKIRHCLNIEGVERQLPLFQPPIEPGLLVRARAAGVDISSVLSDIGAPLPHFRFPVVLEKALEFCKDVKSLGKAFLNALEKKDAEGLVQLKSRQLTPDLRGIKTQQIEEAEKSLESLQKAQEIAVVRKEHAEEASEITKWEVASLASTAAEKATLIGASVAHSFASNAAVFPDFYQGTAGISSPLLFAVTVGGGKTHKAADSWAKWLGSLSKVLANAAEVAKLVGQIEQRTSEWEHKKNVISREIEQIDRQIEAAKIRVAIAKKDFENYERELDNRKEVDTYMRDRFTNLELYNWHVSQLSSLYFQSYQMAYDLAKRAEKVFHYELGGDETSYIHFGYWDSLKKGLLAGEKLRNDLRRLEAAYLDQNRRDFEITKHISLAMCFPEELLDLKTDGECSLELLEGLFDLDYPGHYLRRIKSVGLSVDCDASPYTSINSTLTLTWSTVRKQATLTNGGYERVDGDDPRFQDKVGVTQSIVTSSARDDSGLFELNFNDERYLPFEGAGAISHWHLELPKKSNQIDAGAISDVILHVRYTARDGGKSLREESQKAVWDEISNQEFGRLIDVKEAFAQAWDDFLSRPGEAGNHALNLPLRDSLFPAMFHGRVKITAAWLCLRLKDECDAAEEFPLPFTLSPAGSGEFKVANESGVVCAKVENLDPSPGTWKLTIEEDHAKRLESVENMLIWIAYKV